MVYISDDIAVELSPLNRTYMGNIILDEAVRHSRVAEIFDNLLDNVKKLGVGYRSLLCS